MRLSGASGSRTAKLKYTGRCDRSLTELSNRDMLKSAKNKEIDENILTIWVG